MFTEVHRIETCGYTLNVDRSYNRTERAHTFEVLVTRNGFIYASEGPFSSKREATERANNLAAEYEARAALVAC